MTACTRRRASSIAAADHARSLSSFSATISPGPSARLIRISSDLLPRGSTTPSCRSTLSLLESSKGPNFSFLVVPPIDAELEHIWVDKICPHDSTLPSAQPQNLVGLSDPFPPLLTACVSVICHSGNRLFKLSLCPMISPPFARFAASERS